MIGEDYRRSFQLKTGHPPGQKNRDENGRFHAKSSHHFAQSALSWPGFCSRPFIFRDFI
jgi:hypothetical protein